MLDKATTVAEISNVRSGYRHGSIIVKSGNVVSVGINRDKNHPDHVADPRTQASVHAEVAALKAAGKMDLSGAVLYVARILRSGDQAMSKPCVNCQKAIAEAGIKKVYYTIDNEMDI